MPDSLRFPAEVSWSPAAMPPTCVAWNDSAESNGSLAPGWTGDAGANVRCTITLGVANRVWPFGKPGGYERPVASKNLCEASRPSSMIPILIPLPAVSRPVPHSLLAPITSGPWVIVDARLMRTAALAYDALGHVLAIPGTFASSGTLLSG